MTEPLHGKGRTLSGAAPSCTRHLVSAHPVHRRAEASCTRAARETYDACVQDPKVPCSSRRFRQPGKAELLVRHAVGKRCLRLGCIRTCKLADETLLRDAGWPGPCHWLRRVRPLGPSGAGVTRSWSKAKTTAAARSRSSSLVNRWLMWVLTVPSLTNRPAAISVLVLPCPMSASTSRSRLVRASRAGSRPARGGGADR